MKLLPWKSFSGGTFLQIMPPRPSRVAEIPRGVRGHRAPPAGGARGGAPPLGRLQGAPRAPSWRAGEGAGRGLVQEPSRARGALACPTCVVDGPD